MPPADGAAFRFGRRLDAARWLWCDDGVRFEITTKATPDQALAALTDFTEARLRIWSRTLDPATYQLRESGETWAVAREGTAGSPFLIVSRYDWSEPGVVRWTVVESNYGGGGEGYVRISAGPGGGSRLRAEWSTSGGRPVQRFMLALVHRGPGRLLIPRMWRFALDRYAETAAEPRP